MSAHVVLLTIPGLRERDLPHMPSLSAWLAEGTSAPLVPSFPAVTCPVQMNMLTGELPAKHGVVANGFFWRDQGSVEMWTAWNKVVQRPQLWDQLRRGSKEITSAAWFGLLTKGCGADFVCTPAPIHNPDGSESLWCYTQPTELYGTLRDRLGHFPLRHFWGPLANIQSSRWIVESAVVAAERYRPNFFWIYVPHLDYAAQKFGPNSPAAETALRELDELLGTALPEIDARLADGSPSRPLWLVASEYAIVPVSHVSFPNRTLREAGLLQVLPEPEGQGELLDVRASTAWALVDHQFSHVFVRERDAAAQRRVADLFRGQEGIAEVLVGDDLKRHDLNHERSGDVVLVSAADSWQAYYYWLDDARAPSFARTVDIHRKPGYDPVELFFDPPTKGIPLDAALIKGSHGAPVADEFQRGVILASQPGVLLGGAVADTDIADIVARQFGI